MAEPSSTRLAPPTHALAHALTHAHPLAHPPTAPAHALNTHTRQVQSVGQVSTQFESIRRRVKGLRKQVRDCKSLLTKGMREQPIKELWERKLEYTAMLTMLDNLEALRDAPRAIERLVQEKRFVAAVSHFNRMNELMFSEDLMDVSALKDVRDEIHARKVRLLDTIVSEVQTLLFALPSSSTLAPPASSSAMGVSDADVTSESLDSGRDLSKELESSLADPVSIHRPRNLVTPPALTHLPPSLGRLPIRACSSSYSWRRHSS